MFFGLWPLIYRERRRLILVTFLAFLAGFLFYLRADVYVNGVHIALITGAIYAGVVGSAALLVCLFLPRLRFMIEAIAIARLALSVFVLVAPGIGYQILASPLVTASIVVFGGFAISRLIHGRILSERRPGWRARILPGPFFQRAPARIVAGPLQYRFVGWLDDTAPIAA